MKQTGLVLLFISSLHFSCYQKVEGCLDISAANFQVESDIHCCCKYPNVTLSVYYKFGDLDMSIDSIYYNQFDQAFKINDLRFFVSTFQLEKEMEARYGISDTLRFSDSGPHNEILPDDIILVDQKNNSPLYTVGSFRKSGDFESFSFDIGLPYILSGLDNDDFNSSHVLYYTEEKMRKNDHFVDFDISLIKNPTTNPDTVQIQLLEIVTDLTFDTLFYATPGNNINLAIELDYEKMLAEVNFDEDDENIMSSKIVTNLSSCFSLRE